MILVCRGGHVNKTVKSVLSTIWDDVGEKKEEDRQIRGCSTLYKHRNGLAMSNFTRAHTTAGDLIVIQSNCSMGAAAAARL